MSKGNPNPTTQAHKVVKLDPEWALDIPAEREGYMYLMHHSQDPYLDDNKLKCNYGGTWINEDRLNNPWCSCGMMFPQKIYKKLLMLYHARKNDLRL